MYDGDRSSFGIGDWGLMSYGSWNDGGNTPAHPSAWCKVLLGWITPTQITPDRSPVENMRINQAETPGATVIQLLDNPNGADDWDWLGNGTGEYFLVESRQLVGYDSALPGAGLLIWHIDESRGNNDTEAHKLVDLEAADGRNDLDINNNQGDPRDPFSSDNAGFTHTTNPNSDLYDGTISGASITNISSAAQPMTADFQVPSFSISVSPTLDSVIAGKSTSVTVTVTSIGYFSDTVSLSASGLPAGASASFSSSSGTPTFDSTMKISTSSSTPWGEYTITITGEGGDLTRTCTYTLTVGDFSVSVSPDSGTVGQGESISTTVNVVGNCTGSVSLSVSGLPPGAVDGGGNPQGIPPFSSSFTISTSSSTPTDNYSITVTASGGGVSHSCTYDLTVVPRKAGSISDAEGDYWWYGDGNNASRDIKKENFEILPSVTKFKIRTYGSEWYRFVIPVHYSSGGNMFLPDSVKDPRTGDTAGWGGWEYGDEGWERCILTSPDGGSVYSPEGKEGSINYISYDSAGGYVEISVPTDLLFPWFGNESRDVAVQAISLKKKPSGLFTADGAPDFGVYEKCPVSSVDPIPSGWRSSLPFGISATAENSGVREVRLYYRYSPDNRDWTNWRLFGTDEEYCDDPVGDGHRYYDNWDSSRDITSLGQAVEENRTTFVVHFDNLRPDAQNNALDFYIFVNSEEGGAQYVPDFVKTPDNAPAKWGGEPEGWEKCVAVYDWRGRVLDENYESVGYPTHIEFNTEEDYAEVVVPTSLLFEDENSDFSMQVISVNQGNGRTADGAPDFGAYQVRDKADNWRWSFDAPMGDGYYEFFSMAVDVYERTEWLTESVDASCRVDTGKPVSRVDNVHPVWRDSGPVKISATASDSVSGLSSVRLFYRYSENGLGWSSWKLYGVDDEPGWSWSFVPVENSGLYEFYSVAVDDAGNVEEAPLTADASFGVEIPADVGLSPKTLNLESRGRWVTAYVELPGGYEPEYIDVSTVSLNGVPAENDPKYGFVRNPSLRDRDGDGLSELMVKFDRSEVEETLESGDNVEVVVSGMWRSVKFEGSCSIRVI